MPLRRPGIGSGGQRFLEAGGGQHQRPAIARFSGFNRKAGNEQKEEQNKEPMHATPDA
ncbi:hypothetical protein TomTYG45_32230 [Sphingobium sp. TomTYG45]